MTVLIAKHTRKTASYIVSGSKLSMSVALHLARIDEVLSIVSLGIQMYWRKQSLDHRPNAWMSHLGHPAAAAVEAAPMRSEWEEMFILSPVDSTRSLLTSRLDRYLPFVNVNKGPDFEGWVVAR